MKTAEEVAEEIWHWIVGSDRNIPSSEIIKHIAQALTAYAEERVRIALDQAFLTWEKQTEERVKEALKNWTTGTDFTPLLDLAANKARAEALEEACDVVNKKMCGHQMDITDKIRALKDKS